MRIHPKHSTLNNQHSTSKTILLTGGLGFIGSHTAVELISKGYEVVIVDNLSNTRIEVLDAIHRVSGVKPAYENIDLSDKRSVKELCEKYKFDGCIHFAAFKAVGDSVEEPLIYYKNNIDQRGINTTTKFVSYNTTKSFDPEKNHQVIPGKTNPRNIPFYI